MLLATTHDSYSDLFDQDVAYANSKGKDITYAGSDYRFIYIYLIAQNIG